MLRDTNIIKDISESFQNEHSKKEIILGFDSFLKNVAEDPLRYMRNSPSYIKDMIDHYGTKSTSDNSFSDIRYKLFDRETDRSKGIIGGEAVHADIYRNLNRFVREGYSNKLILLHGPNGSAKSSTVDSLAQGMATYSETNEGVVYRFNWIFPTDKSSNPLGADSGPIGFQKGMTSLQQGSEPTFAHLDESRIASRISSEFKENPLFLLPMPYRETVLRSLVADKEGITKEQVDLPIHILKPGLSKKNQQIFECLLNAYRGDLAKVLRHIQVERFFYSKQYRVGISTVEPQMRVDASEKQLTADRNMANLPSVLQNLSFYEAFGELVESNRGLLEFSDLLKRPVEAFKYLLSTVECGSVNLTTGTALLDTVYIATTNEKHLDGFKTIPDFSSFKERIDLITVPYLLRVQDEIKIYEHDLESLKKSNIIAPHTLEYLCMWVVMTRLKQPDTENFPKDIKPLVAKIDPFTKLCIYDERGLPSHWSSSEKQALKNLRNALIQESKGLVVYEGRFGASPRDTKGILNKTCSNQNLNSVTPLDIFSELRSLIRDRTVYEFLQFEPRGKYHDAASFIEMAQESFLKVFETETLHSMGMVDDHEYENLLKRYIDHVVAEIKNETIWDKATNSFIQASNIIMQDVEKILGKKILGSQSAQDYRRSILNRIASFKIENPNKEFDLTSIFTDLLSAIKEHFHNEKQQRVEEIYRAMLSEASKNKDTFSATQTKEAELTFKNLESTYGYSKDAAEKCLKALLTFKSDNKVGPTKKS